MMKILLADDFALLREDLCETLGTQPDMEVVGAAESGAQVQEMAQKLDFDVLLIDIEMENTTAGIHAAENILAEKPDTIVIFLTAHETENMILMSMGAGAVDYVVKGCRMKSCSNTSAKPTKANRCSTRGCSIWCSRSIPACAARKRACCFSSTTYPS